MKPYQKNRFEIDFFRSIERNSRSLGKDEAIRLLFEQIEKMENHYSKNIGTNPKKKIRKSRVTISKGEKLETLVESLGTKKPFKSSFAEFMEELREGIYDIEAA